MNANVDPALLLIEGIEAKIRESQRLLASLKSSYVRAKRKEALLESITARIVASESETITTEDENE